MARDMAAVDDYATEKEYAKIAHRVMFESKFQEGYETEEDIEELAAEAAEEYVLNEDKLRRKMLSAWENVEIL